MNMSTPNTRHLYGHNGTLALFVHDGNDHQGYESLSTALSKAANWMAVQERLMDVDFINATPQFNLETEGWEVHIVADIANAMEYYE